jgi:hypothetical protein
VVAVSCACTDDRVTRCDGIGISVGMPLLLLLVPLLLLTGRTMMGAVPFNDTAGDGERVAPEEDGAVTRITPGDAASEEAAEAAAVATTPTATGCRFGLTLTART